MKKSNRPLSAGLGFLLSLSATAVGAEGMSHQASEPPHSAHADHAMHSSHGQHAKHMEMLDKMGKDPVYQRTEHDYRIPDVTLIDGNNTPLHLPQLFSKEEPVVVNFIYTSCTTVCPVLSATLAEAQSRLQNSAHPPQVVSISIDPTYDTPERLKAYAENYQAGSRWHFLTGNTDSIVQAQRAFDAYRGDKSNHIPLTFIRGPGEHKWVRIEGFTSASELVREYERLTRL